MDTRIENIRIQLEKERLDGLIVSLPANISYLANFTSRDAYLLVSKRKNIYITDFRYIAEAKKNLSHDFIIKKTNGSIFKVIADACKNLKLKRIGFEERYLPFAEYKKIKAGLSGAERLIPIYGLIEELRQIKNWQEIERIKKATRITIMALKFIKGFIKPGIKEVEIAAELERFIRYHGASASGFDIIVASGPNSSFPHHLTSQRKVKCNEPVLIDLGADYLGYKSDLTRVFFLGKINTSLQRIYDIVLEAKIRAIKKIKPFVNISTVDKVARQYITQKGYGGFFGHNLGHGVGLEVHEGPHISSKEVTCLQPGMVFTVEPAIYLPGRFGIRIEDMVVITRKGSEVLSGSLDK